MQTVQNFDSQLDTDLEGAKKGVEYFKALLNAHSAVKDVLEHQLKVAQEILKELQTTKKQRNGVS